MGDTTQASIFDAVAFSQPALSTKDAILAAAARSFLRLGYEGTSMERIAQEAGTARRTLYNQFPDGKEAIFRAVVERVWKAYPILEIVSDADALADPRVGLRRIGDAVAAFWAPVLAISFLRLVIAEGPRFPHLTQSFFDVGKTPAMSALRGYLETLGKSRKLAIADAELATRQFLGLVNEPLLWVRLIGKVEEVTPQRRRMVVEQAVEIFLGHYRAPGPRENGRAPSNAGGSGESVQAMTAT